MMMIYDDDESILLLLLLMMMSLMTMIYDNHDDILISDESGNVDVIDEEERDIFCCAGNLPNCFSSKDDTKSREIIIKMVERINLGRNKPFRRWIPEKQKPWKWHFRVRVRTKEQRWNLY